MTTQTIDAVPMSITIEPTQPGDTIQIIMPAYPVGGIGIFGPNDNDLFVDTTGSGIMAGSVVNTCAAPASSTCPQGTMLTMTASGSPGSFAVTWEPPGGGSQSTCTIVIPNVEPTVVNAAGRSQALLNYLNAQQQPAPGLSTTAKLAIGAAVVAGVGSSMAAYGVATGNGAGYLFGLAAEEAAKAAETARRRTP